MQINSILGNNNQNSDGNDSENDNKSIIAFTDANNTIKSIVTPGMFCCVILLAVQLVNVKFWRNGFYCVYFLVCVAL